jgi:hypothetical protein
VLSRNQKILIVCCILFACYCLFTQRWRSFPWPLLFARA